jgi:hypothetical protein
MARISKYKLDEKVTKEDFVIGSDGFTKKTRNYRMSDIVEFLGTQDPILGDKFAYTYNQNVALGALKQGEISFNNRADIETRFSSVAQIYLNRVNIYGVDVYEYLNKIKDYDAVLNLHVANNPIYTGVFVVRSVNIFFRDVIVLGVDMRLENGFMKTNDNILVSSSYKALTANYTHSQLVASQTWTIQHNLNKRPSVTVVDDGDNVVFADVQYINENSLTITFAGAISGKAYLN